MKGNNKFGAAGRNGTPAREVVEFLDHYTYPDEDTNRKRINGVLIADSDVRSIRRWRNGQVENVSHAALERLLHRHGFTEAWYGEWHQGG